MEIFHEKIQEAVRWPKLSGNLVIAQNSKIHTSGCDNLQMEIKGGAEVEIICYQKSASSDRRNQIFLMDQNCKVTIKQLVELNALKRISEQWEIFHSAPNTFSDCRFWSVLKDNSSQVLDATIQIKNGMKGSNTNFEHHAVLLSELAKIHSVPRLEIFEKEVLAKHKVSIGQLDEEKVFYLNSRGFTILEAKNLILEGLVSQFWEINS